MVFSSFRFKILFRVVILTLLIILGCYLLVVDKNYVSTFVLLVFILISISELIYYLENTNRKLTRFLESVKYSDFTSSFAHDSKLGKSFEDLNRAFNTVLDAFRSARKEKEEHFQYLNTIVQHVNTGLLSFDSSGKIGLINNTAKRYLNTPQLKNIKDVQETSEVFYNALIECKPGEKKLVEIDQNAQYSLSSTQIKLKGNSFNLIAIQNIKSELEENEIQAWQNLTRVLRHEIMNSITPIASLTSTLNDILMEDLQQKNGHYEITEDSLTDVKDGLSTIESRSKGLITFVDGYRDYTSIPKPKPRLVPVKEMLEHVIYLVAAEIKQKNIDLKLALPKSRLELYVDQDLIEMVLINLLKNAKEALEDHPSPRIEVAVLDFDPDKVYITITDNGPGIIPEAMEKVFIPFFTTKKTGSGIGLALSKQIMQLHNGSLSLESIPDQETRFTLTFKRRR